MSSLLQLSVCYYFDLLLGCNRSSVSCVLYVKRDAREKRIAWSISIAVFSMVAFSYTPTVLSWLSTIIFGVPSPDHWALPLRTDKAYAHSFFFIKSNQKFGKIVISMENFRFVLNRIPAETHTPFRFGVVLMAELILCGNYFMLSALCLIFYVCICTYFWLIVDDLSVIIVQQSEDIEHQRPAKETFVQFITLHEDLYKYFTNTLRIVYTKWREIGKKSHLFEDKYSDK